MVPRLEQMSPQEIVDLINGYQPTREYQERLYAVLSGVDAREQNHTLIDAYHAAQLALLRRETAAIRADTCRMREECRRMCGEIIAEIIAEQARVLTPSVRGRLSTVAPQVLEEWQSMPERLRAAVQEVTRA